MPAWAVRGSYLARRNTWQRFTKVRDAPDPEKAKEIVLSEIGGSHRVPRKWVRIDSVEPTSEDR